MILSAQFEFTDLEVEARGTIRKAESGYGFTEIVVRPSLKIASLEERELRILFHSGK
jgi:hypothetical protein